MSAADPIRVAIVNDYQIVVEGLRNMLAPFSDRIHVVELETGGVPEHAAHIALFDTFAARRGVSDRIAAMSSRVHIDKVVLYTWDAPTEFVGDTGDVDAIVLKSTTGPALVDSLVRIHSGERVGLDLVATGPDSSLLTVREQEVLALLAQGRTNRNIADELYLSIDTVKTHVKKVFSKLEVSNRTQAAIKAQELGFGPPRT